MTSNLSRSTSIAGWSVSTWGEDTGRGVVGDLAGNVSSDRTHGITVDVDGSLIDDLGGDVSGTLIDHGDQLFDRAADNLTGALIDDRDQLLDEPAEGGVQRGRAKQDQHRTVGVTYCSMQCARAQANRDYRKRKRQETK